MYNSAQNQPLLDRRPWCPSGRTRSHVPRSRLEVRCSMLSVRPGLRFHLFSPHSRDSRASIPDTLRHGSTRSGSIPPNPTFNFISFFLRALFPPPRHLVALPSLPLHSPFHAPPSAPKSDCIRPQIFSGVCGARPEGLYGSLSVSDG